MLVIKQPTTKFTYAFIYSFNYETLNFCRALKTKLGNQQFTFFEKAWRFNDLAVVELIKFRYPAVTVDVSVLPDIERWTLQQLNVNLQVQKAEELKKATDSSLVVTGLKRELYPYQRIGVEFLLNNNGKALLADAPGVGKSAQALAYIAHTKITKTLVVCPASVKGSWAMEVKKVTKLSSYTINSKTDLTLDLISEYDIFIINYDVLPKFLKILTTARFDCVVLDEVQYIKSSSARRTKCAKLICRRIPSVILLSGTPMLNRPVELFNSLNLLDPVVWGDYYAFTKRYCDGHQGDWGYDASGASNIEELQGRISRYFLRRTKNDVLKELPPKTFVDVPIELENGIKTKYDYAERSFIEYLRDIKNKSREEINRSLAAEKLTKLNELRQLTSAGKISAAKEVIENIIESGEKIVVFSVYNEPIRQLKEYFGDKAVMILGSVDEDERNQAINDFQNNEEKVVFLGGMKSAGVGITLTAAANVLLIDYPWVPADREQAIDRIHRPGQTATHATIYQLIASNTIDQKMQAILESKQEIFNQLIENQTVVGPKQTSMVDDLIKSFNIDKKYEST